MHVAGKLRAISCSMGENMKSGRYMKAEMHVSGPSYAMTSRPTSIYARYFVGDGGINGGGKSSWTKRSMKDHMMIQDNTTSFWHKNVISSETCLPRYFAG